MLRNELLKAESSLPPVGGGLRSEGVSLSVQKACEAGVL
jgi:hypothetical protein